MLPLEIGRKNRLLNKENERTYTPIHNLIQFIPFNPKGEREQVIQMGSTARFAKKKRNSIKTCK